jgi:hypothetical protein
MEPYYRNNPEVKEWDEIDDLVLKHPDADTMLHSKETVQAPVKEIRARESDETGPPFRHEDY